MRNSFKSHSKVRTNPSLMFFKSKNFSQLSKPNLDTLKLTQYRTLHTKVPQQGSNYPYFDPSLRDFTDKPMNGENQSLGTDIKPVEFEK